MAQLDLFLDNPLFNPPKKVLCKDWKCSVKNEFGVFIDPHISTLDSGNREYEIKMALLYPYVYYAFGFRKTSGDFYGKSSPCMEDENRINVFESALEVQSHLERDLLDYCSNDNVPKEDVIRCVKMMVDQM